MRNALALSGNGLADRRVSADEEVPLDCDHDICKSLTLPVLMSFSVL